MVDSAHDSSSASSSVPTCTGRETFNSLALILLFVFLSQVNLSSLSKIVVVTSWWECFVCLVVLLSIVDVLSKVWLLFYMLNQNAHHHLLLHLYLLVLDICHLIHSRDCYYLCCYHNKNLRHFIEWKSAGTRLKRTCKVNSSTLSC